MQGCGVIGGRKHELHPRSGTCKGEAPACRMEHRHDRQQCRLRAKIKNGWRDFSHRVQHGRAVLIQNTLWIACCAAGVTQHARVAFVARCPFIIAILRGDERTVAVVAVKNDIMLNGLQMRLQPVYDGLEHCVIHQHLIFGMVHDVDQVFVEQPHIDRVDHSTKADSAIPSRQMPMMVHGKSGNPVALLQAQTRKGLRQFARFGGDARPVCAFNIAVGPTRHDFARAMFAGCVVDQTRNAKIPILHGAVHQNLSLIPRRTILQTQFLSTIFAVQRTNAKTGPSGASSTFSIPSIIRT